MVRKFVPLFLLLTYFVSAHAQTRSLASSPTSLSFGSITTGTSASKSVTLTNNGTYGVKISSITSNSTEFKVAGITLPRTLYRGGKVTFNVKFVPQTAGSKAAAIKVYSNATNSPTINATGTGLAPAPAPAPTPTPTPTPTAGYGNVGDPYEGASPGSATLLSACQILTPNISYRLSRSVNAATATDVCFQITGPNIKLDLAGYKVTGRIVGNAEDISGTQIFNGSIECRRDAALGGNVGCVFLYGDYFAPTAQLKLHHLNLYNSAACGRTIQLNWDTGTGWSGAPYVARLYNITSSTAPGPDCDRAYNFGVMTSDVITVEVHNNDLTCAADTAACQGVMFYGNDHGRMHHNRVTMLQNYTPETGRALLCDGGADYCEIDNNLIIVNNNRAFRVRDSAHARIHDNTVQRVTCCGATAVHLGDPDSGSNDLDVILERNSFEVVDGTVLMIRGGYNAWFRNNTLTCSGCSGSTNLAEVRTMGTTNIVFENNPTATALGSPQVIVETSAKATLCNSGQATGSGTIVYSTACSP